MELFIKAVFITEIMQSLLSIFSFGSITDFTLEKTYIQSDTLPILPLKMYSRKSEMKTPQFNTLLIQLDITQARSCILTTFALTSAFMVPASAASCCISVKSMLVKRIYQSGPKPLKTTLGFTERLTSTP